MDPKVRFVDEVAPLPDTDLYRVRGVDGVDWAVPFYKGTGRVRLDDGRFQNVMLLGLDDNSCSSCDLAPEECNRPCHRLP